MAWSCLNACSRGSWCGRGLFSWAASFPQAGLSLDGTRWVAASPRFLLPGRVLSRVFRGKLLAELQQLLLHGKLQFHGSLLQLSDRERFRQFLRQLHSKDWVVYAKPPSRGAEHLLHYLARYTHRVVISNHRLVGFSGGRVSFRWKDYAAGSKQKVMTLPVDEFLRRFLIHVLPKGLVRIRHFGLFANRRRSASQMRCRQVLGALSSPQQPRPTSHTRCSLCSGDMLIVERMTGSQLHFRSTLTSFHSPLCGFNSS